MALLKLLSKLGLIFVLLLAYLTYEEQVEWENTVLAGKNTEVILKQKALQSQIAELKKTEEFLADSDQKKKQLFELREEVDRQAKTVPQRAAIPEVLAELDARAAKTGLVFSKFAPQSQIKQRFLVLTPFTVKLRGTYTQIMSFIDAAANMERAVSTQSLVLGSPSLPKAGASILNAEATLIAFHIDMNALALAAAGDSPTPTESLNKNPTQSGIDENKNEDSD